MIVIDRFEEEIAVIEKDNKTFNIPKNLLPSEAKEGDVLKIFIEIDKKETEKRKKKIDTLIEDLFE